MTDSYMPKTRRMLFLLATLVTALVLLLQVYQTSRAAVEVVDLSGSEKRVDKETAAPGDVLHYTLVISNSGSGAMDFAGVNLTDTLPAELRYVSGTLTAPVGTAEENNGVITWIGAINPEESIEVSFDAQLTTTVAVSEVITNTVVISGDGSPLTRSVATTVVSPTTTADLSGSSKSVFPTSVEPGDLVTYTLVVSNSTPTPGADTDVLITDTLPADLSYHAGSFTFPPGTGQVDGNTITWQGTVNADAEAEISFQAMVDSGLTTNRNIVNSVQISGTNVESPAVPFTRSVSLDVVYRPLTIHLPFIAHPLPAMNLTAGRADQNNSWTLTWGTIEGVTGYELQESHDSDFQDGVTVVALSPGTTFTVRQHDASTENVYYYRIRALSNSLAGDWSNVEKVVGAYNDNFDDDDSGWVIARQDTDDVDNRLFYSEDDGDSVLNLEMNSRWDYMIASPLVEAPPPPYRIETRLRFAGVDNLHGYGIIFGGDYDGSDCPNIIPSGCFGHYYRMRATWFGNDNKLKAELKRIFYHDPPDNAGRGVTLLQDSEARVASDSEDYQDWVIEVGADGRIWVQISGHELGTAYDLEYINNPYFGLFAATDEYTGLDAQADYFRITPLP